MIDVSIVMPVYNGEKYLKESIDSIRRQTYQEWELIMVNDCSTDSSLQIMQEYAALDTRITVITNEENKKLPRSLNVGFERVQGNFLTWTSADNIYQENAIAVMHEFLIEHNEYGMVYCDMWYIDEKGNVIGSVSKEVKGLYCNNCIGACFMYRSEMLDTVGEYNLDMFLVEDYEYWLRINKKYEIYHLSEMHYFYRNHADSLTKTRTDKVNKQLYKLRVQELDFLLKKINNDEKLLLFFDMWSQNKDKNIKDKFFPNGNIPDDLAWVERGRTMDENKKIILFGAGDFGKKALYYFGQEKIAFFADNNEEKVGSFVDGKEVISYNELVKIHDKYNIVIAVDARKASILAKQLENNNVKEYITYLEMVNNLKRPEVNGEKINWINSFNKVVGWIKLNSIPNGGIINNSNMKKSYPEVTGYYIPTLMRWGYRDMAVGYAKWLCSSQKEDGSWYDTEDKNPYVFDTAQILKGLLAVSDIYPKVEENIISGCDWILSNIQESGRLTTPSKDDWGEEGVCSELIHLYCLSPLIDAGRKYGRKEYNDAANKVTEYYVNKYQEEILNFNILSHFYAYVMEALCDLDRKELAREAMKKIADLQDDKGMVPAYKNVKWVCSTGLFQFAIVWYKLGEIELGDKALHFATQLQNESGGWCGSYATVENPKITDSAEYPNYFQDSEISWAGKYFLDAVYYKCKMGFEKLAPIFLDNIEKTDGRYQILLNEIEKNHAKKICDVGCGKGRYIKNLIEDKPGLEISAVDLSVNVMKGIQPTIDKKQGSLTQIPYQDETFDIVYTAEALEHAVAVENAIEELLRVTKKGGKVIIIDKDKKAMGYLEIEEWEQWFEDEFFEKMAKQFHCNLIIHNNLSYENKEADGLFSAWILEKSN